MAYCLTHQNPDFIRSSQSLIAEKEAICRNNVIEQVIKKCLGRDAISKKDYERFKLVLDDRFPRFEFIEFDEYKIGYITSTLKQAGHTWVVTLDFYPLSGPDAGNMVALEYDEIHPLVYKKLLPNL